MLEGETLFVQVRWVPGWVETSHLVVSGPQGYSWSAVLDIPV